MPPKVKITKEMIIDAAFEIARSEGAENINARTVSKKLGCSTQPVMYHFKTIEELKKTVYVKADEYHSEYITNIQSENPMKDIGLNYIRFAETEKNLFRFLFQTNEFIGKNICELINSEELQPIIVAAGLFCRKMDGRFCRKKPDTDVRRAGRIDVAGVFCRTREGRGQSRSLH